MKQDHGFGTIEPPFTKEEELTLRTSIAELIRRAPADKLGKILETIHEVLEL